MTETLGKYRLVRLLATGGMAEVYLARQAGAAGFEKQVCLKRILPHLARDQRFVAMFLDEARLASRLDHPNIVSIFDLGEANGSYFIAMEYIDGPTLRAVAQRASERAEPLPVAEVVRIAAQAAGGLQYAHELRAADGRSLGLVHRDVSPDNVMVHRNGAVKIVDFGIAKAAGTRGATHTGTLKGKVAYMAPEALRGEPLDRRADVFALGVVLYELLAGRRPWEAASEVALISCIVNEEPRPLPELRPDVPQELWAIVARALAKDAGQRIQTCGELQAELERHLIAWGESVTSSRLAQFVAACAPQEPVPAPPAARPRTPDLLELSTPARGGEPTPADRPSRPPPSPRTARALQQEFRDEPRVPAGRAKVVARTRSRGPAVALAATAAVLAAALVGAAAAAGGSGGAWAGWARLTAAAHRLGPASTSPAETAAAADPTAAADAPSAIASGRAIPAAAAAAAGPDPVAPSAAAGPGSTSSAASPAGASALAAGAVAAAPPAGTPPAGPAAEPAAAATTAGAPSSAGSTLQPPAPAGAAALSAGLPALARAADPGDGGFAARAASPDGGAVAARDPAVPEASARGDEPAAGGVAAPRAGAGAPGDADAAKTPAPPQPAARAQAQGQATRKPRRPREEDRLSALANIAPDGPPEPAPEDAAPAAAPAVPAPEARPPRATASAPSDTEQAAAAPKAPAGKGELLLLVRPWARVEVDGRTVGDTPLASPLELAEGDHQVRLVNPDLGKDVTRTVHVRARERAVLKEMLDE